MSKELAVPKRLFFKLADSTTALVISELSLALNAKSTERPDFEFRQNMQNQK